jgi:hypothetical protein
MRSTEGAAQEPRERKARGSNRHKGCDSSRSTHLLLVLLELGGRRLLESYGQGRNSVVVGAALQAGEDRLVDGLLKVVLDFVALGVLIKPDPLSLSDEAVRSIQSSANRVKVLGGG